MNELTLLILLSDACSSPFALGAPKTSKAPDRSPRIILSMAGVRDLISRVWLLSPERGVAKHVVYSPAEIASCPWNCVGECWHLLSVTDLGFRDDWTCPAHICFSLTTFQYDIYHFTSVNLHSSIEIQSFTR